MWDVCFIWWALDGHSVESSTDVFLDNRVVIYFHFSKEHLQGFRLLVHAYRYPFKENACTRNKWNTILLSPIMGEKDGENHQRKVVDSDLSVIRGFAKLDVMIRYIIKWSKNPSRSTGPARNTRSQFTIGPSNHKCHKAT